MEKISSLCIILAGTFWGSIGLFVRALGQLGLGSLNIVMGRSAVCLLVIALVLLLFKREQFRIELKHIWCFMGSGIVGILGFNLCYFKTIETSSLSVAAVLLYTAPVFVTILSAIIFKEKITPIKVLALILAIGGCILVSGALSQSGGLKGSALIIGIAAGLGYALYTIFTRFAVNYGYGPLTIQFYTFLLSLAGGLFFVDWDNLGDVLFGENYAEFLLLMLLAGIITTAIPNVLYTKGLEHVENGKASVMASIEPVMATVFGLVIYKEVPTASAIAGILLVISAIILLNLKLKDRNNI